MENLKLRDCLPKEFCNGEYENTKAYLLRDHSVKEVHRSPPWIGTHSNVHTRIELECGLAVGWNESPSRGWSFPVVKIQNKI